MRLAFILFLVSAQALAADGTPGDDSGHFWVYVISQVGFPIVVSGALLWILDKRLIKLITLMTSLIEVLRARRAEDDKP